MELASTPEGRGARGKPACYRASPLLTTAQWRLLGEPQGAPSRVSSRPAGRDAAPPADQPALQRRRRPPGPRRRGRRGSCSTT